MKFLNERDLYLWLKGNVPGHWTRIETSTGAGVPDVNYCIGDPPAEGWAELKVLSYVSQARTMGRSTPIQVGLRPSQAAWITQRVTHGGRVSILIGTAWGEIILACPLDVGALMRGYGLTYRELMDRCKVVTADGAGAQQLRSFLTRSVV